MLVTACPTDSQNAAPTPNAWGKARWGMNIEEFLAAYPGMKAYSSMYFFDVTCDYLNLINIDGQKYRQLIFGFKNNHLNEIATGVDETYEQAIVDLTKKYGPPTKRDVPLFGGDPTKLTYFVDKIRGNAVIVSDRVGANCGKYITIRYSSNIDIAKPF
jgi:hypothetical protein